MRRFHVTARLSVVLATVEIGDANIWVTQLIAENAISPL